MKLLNSPPGELSFPFSWLQSSFMVSYSLDSVPCFGLGDSHRRRGRRKHCTIVYDI